ncbi:hypothetical protein [Polaromonas sp.]|uniref:DarT1-associated NADAR antitoxin family protein n=1 Tax=Polaromonas sp. TaxID=1869339 RepID=UPI00352515C5
MPATSGIARTSHSGRLVSDVATRPVFTPFTSGKLLVWTHHVDFEWFPGMAKVQAQKSIASLHQNAMRQIGVDKVLEISSKSLDELGVDHRERRRRPFPAIRRPPRPRTLLVPASRRTSRAVRRSGHHRNRQQ